MTAIPRSEEQQRLVREGYNLIATAYHARRAARELANIEWLEEKWHLLPASGRVIDLGCGSGVPITRFFAQRGYEVTGYDVSDSMLELACREVPNATFIRCAMEGVKLPHSSVDLVVSFFAIIHVDRTHHAELFRNMHAWLEPGGKVLLSLGRSDSEYWHEQDWHGAPMSWSHFDAETNLSLLRQAGFEILWSAIEETGPQESHLFVVGAKSD